MSCPAVNGLAAVVILYLIIGCILSWQMNFHRIRRRYFHEAVIAPAMLAVLLIAALFNLKSIKDKLM